MNYLCTKLSELENVVLYKSNGIPSTVVSINVEGYSSEDAAHILNDDFGICVRAGYHCAPFIHDFIGSKIYKGTIRISLNYFNSYEDLNTLINALKAL